VPLSVYIQNEFLYGLTQSIYNCTSVAGEVCGIASFMCWESPTVYRREVAGTPRELNLWLIQPAVWLRKKLMCQLDHSNQTSLCTQAYEIALNSSFFFWRMVCCASYIMLPSAALHIIFPPIFPASPLCSCALLPLALPLPTLVQKSVLHVSVSLLPFKTIITASPLLLFLVL